MRYKMILCAAMLMAALTLPASALEYTMEAPSAGDFGKATSDTIIYVGNAENNVDRSKNTALVPPGFGTPASYLPGTGKALTPNLDGYAAATATPTISSSTIGAAPATPIAVSFSPLSFSTVTADLYYRDGSLGTLSTPALGLSVKVYEGTDSATLAKGAGHFENTSVWNGNVCIAGHNRGVNCYFGDIHTLALGSTITLSTRYGTRTYAVTSVEKVKETDQSGLASTYGNCLTLYTCVRNQSAYRWCVRANEV